MLHIGGKPDYFFRSDAPKHVELTAFRDEGHVTLNAVALDEESVTADVLPFTVQVKVRAKAVKLLPAGEEIPFTVKDGYTEFKARQLHIFDMYDIIL